MTQFVFCCLKESSASTTNRVVFFVFFSSVILWPSVLSLNTVTQELFFVESPHVDLIVEPSSTQTVLTWPNQEVWSLQYVTDFREIESCNRGWQGPLMVSVHERNMSHFSSHVHTHHDLNYLKYVQTESETELVRNVITGCLYRKQSSFA